MARVNIFIDGSWLFKQCKFGGSLANATENPNQHFALDFEKLKSVLLEHIRVNKGICDRVGDCFIVTSIFDLPDDFDTWVTKYNGITPEQISQTRNGVVARETFVKNALDAGYSAEGVFRPKIRDYILHKLVEGKYQEKQVDTTVVALLVRSAIAEPQDYHLLITGDADMLPAIRVAYPQYTNNVVIATTHPDELEAAHCQTAYSLIDFEFHIPPFFLQDNAEKIISGMHTYKCGECGKVFSRQVQIPRNARPYCRNHRR